MGSFCLFQPNSFMDLIKIKADDVFFIEYFPSSCLSFFLEIGSFELISSAGKTWCIPVIVPVLT